MAGSITFEITPLHIYQRKFNSVDLEEALRFSHLYIVSRRPATRINYTFASRSHVFINFTTKESIDGRAISHDQQFNFPEALGLSVQSYEDGEYFSIRYDDQTLHGDSWSLLSAVTNAMREISWHEVLYVGMAFGKDGERNVGHRIKKHETLQKIYEDHAGTAWDVFVTPVEVNGNTMGSSDHIDDIEEGPDFMTYMRHFQQPSPIVNSRSKLSRESVELIEHALVSVFKPPYNDKLLAWDPTQPTVPMRLVQRIGMRLMILIFHDWHGLARFVSSADKVGQRANLFTFPLSRHSHPGPRGAISGDPFGLISRMQQNFLTMVNQSNDATPVMSVFGPEAPDVRRPPTVHL